MTDEIDTAAKLAAEIAAYRDGYQQGFYDAARGNPSRFEELR